MKRHEKPEATSPQKRTPRPNASLSVREAHPTRGLRINITIQGELSDWVLQWEERGLVRSVSDAVRQALIALREKLQAMDERTARLRAISEATQSDYEEE